MDDVLPSRSILRRVPFIAVRFIPSNSDAKPSGSFGLAAMLRSTRRRFKGLINTGDNQEERRVGACQHTRTRTHTHTHTQAYTIVSVPMP